MLIAMHSQVFLDLWVIIAASNQSLGGIQCVLRVGDGLAFSGHAHQTLPICCEGNHWRGGPGSLCVLQHLTVKKNPIHSQTVFSILIFFSQNYSSSHDSLKKISNSFYKKIHILKTRPRLSQINAKFILMTEVHLLLMIFYLTSVHFILESFKKNTSE